MLKKFIFTALLIGTMLDIPVYAQDDNGCNDDILKALENQLQLKDFSSSKNLYPRENDSGLIIQILFPQPL